MLVEELMEKLKHENPKSEVIVCSRQTGTFNDMFDKTRSVTSLLIALRPYKNYASESGYVASNESHKNTIRAVLIE